MNDNHIKQWKSLDEHNQPLDHTKAAHAHGEGLNQFNSDFLSRREFMEWTGGMVALLSTVGCTRQPEQTLIPYSKTVEEIVPGRPLFYATAMTMGGIASGVLVESHMGRPTKVEGNPDHPGSLGGTDMFAQASVLTLYDPDRAKALSHKNLIVSWEAFLPQLAAALSAHSANHGEGLHILTEPITSPTLVGQLNELLKKYPAAQWHQYDPISRVNEHQGAQLAFGSVVDPQYSFDKADVVVSLDSDFFTVDAGRLRYMRQFTSRRKITGGKSNLNRLYAIESSPTLVGAMADNRLVVRASEVEGLAGALASSLGISVKSVPTLTPERQKWINAIAQELKGRRGAGLVVAGRWQAPVVHALAHAINDRLGNVGTTVIYSEPVLASPLEHTESLRKLAGDMDAGKVQTLLILGANPVYNAPADVPFAALLEKVKFTAYLGLYHDETADRCQWHIPETHFMEQWSDAKAFDGTVTIMQPLIAPLYAGKSAHEVVAALMGSTKSGYEIVQEYWKKHASGDFEKFWRKSLNDGVVAGTALPTKKVGIKDTGWAVVRDTVAPAAGNVEVMFRPDPTVWDGRFANNGWLQEMPKPLTKITWDNAALFSPATAKKMGLSERDVVTLEFQGHKVNAPVWVQPGHPDDAATLHLGYGRWRAGRLGNGTGFSAYTLRTSEAMWIAPSVLVRRVDRGYMLAQTQRHDNMEMREPVRSASLEKYLQDPHFAEPKEREPKTASGVDPGTAGGIYAPAANADYKWGMSINLGSCTGCGSCVVACQAENNIPIVGKVEVRRGRAMHWLRIDRYFEGPPANPETHFQPIPCMHCETAPCEVVCPVGATIHDNEGLNNMVYNRCVGTKYCANNCPYKVRHFNFYEYSDMDTPVLKLQRNPDVTVRSRGVMEKCSYCIQRINHARIDARSENRKIKDGDVKTACQSACPAEAIVFGDLNDPKSLVSMLKAEPLNYGLLAVELNTKPRTTYLAKVKNPNQTLEGAGT